MASPSTPQSHLRYPLTRLLGSAGNVRVLRVLADGPATSATQIASAGGLTPQGVRLVLDTLTAQGIVTVQGSARTQLFQLAAVHPFRQPLLALFSAERNAWEALASRLREQLDQTAGVHAAWLYGSVARGEDTPGSDIDIALLVASPDVVDHVRDAMMHVEDEQRVHVSVTGLTRRELAALRAGDRWWTELVRDARVLKGGSPEAEMKKARARPAMA